MKPLFEKLDFIRLPVPDLEAGLGFYRDKLGHGLIWRSETSAGLRLPGTDCELVLQTEVPEAEPDWKVESADAAADAFVAAGGSMVTPPFDIAIGRCAVVRDPFGNPLVLLDGGKGSFDPDESGRVVGVEKR
jgi:lactoylglutathione lyase